MTENNAMRLAQLAPKIMSAFHDLGRQHPSDEKVSMRQFQALIILAANDHLTLTQIGEKLSLAPSTATELANRMISLELLKKIGEESDKRQVKLTLTPKGIELVKKRQQAMADMFGRFLDPFSISDQEEFVNAFDTIWNMVLKYHAKK
jgi:MarR family transcriptional regulator, organic hydroperoxide resistance regulator